VRPWQVNVLFVLAVCIVAAQFGSDLVGGEIAINPFVTGTAGSIILFFLAAGDKIKQIGNGTNGTKKKEDDDGP
jgi:hypothetical protein